jgi:hypothetical protein
LKKLVGELETQIHALRVQNEAYSLDEKGKHEESRAFETKLFDLQVNRFSLHL